MNNDGTPDISDLTKAAEAATGLLGEIRQWAALTPEDAADRLESRKTRRMLRDVKRIRKQSEDLNLEEDEIKELISDAAKRHQCRFNYEKCVSYAVPLVEDPEAAKSVDPEWEASHREHAEKAYDEETQKLWGRILAGELNEPGSFSKHSMSVLADMSKTDAELFEVFCSLCAGGIDALGIEQPTIPCIFLDEAGTTYNEGSLSYEAVSILAAHGLVQTKSNTVFDQSSGIILCIGGESYRLKEAANESLAIGDATLTVFGQELSRLCKIGSHPNLMKSATAHFLKQGFSLVPSTEFIVGCRSTVGGEGIIEEISSSDLDKILN